MGERRNFETYDMSSKIKEVRSPFSPWEESSSRDMGPALSAAAGLQQRQQQPVVFVRALALPIPLLLSLQYHPSVLKHWLTGMLPPAKLMVKAAFYLWCYLKMLLLHMDFDLTKSKL